MKTTTKTLIAALFIGATSLTAMAPMANAQPRPYGQMDRHGDRDHMDMRASQQINDRISSLQDRLNDRSGRGLSRKEFRRLNSVLSDIRAEKRADDRHGLNPGEAADLNRKLDDLAGRIGNNVHDRNGR